MSRPTFRIQDEIIKAQREQSQQTIDIHKLLLSSEMEDTQYLEGQTIESISKGIYNSLTFRISNKEHLHDIYTKLSGYRLVDEVYLLHRGKYVRWIRNDSVPPKLEIGGIVVDIKITDNGVNVLCKFGSRMTQYRFNECITFQKLSSDEMLILSAYTALLNAHSK